MAAMEGGGAEEAELDSSKVADALSGLKLTGDDEAARQAKEKALAAVTVNKADVDLIVAELELTPEEADRALRESGGDVTKTLRALVQ